MKCTKFKFSLLLIVLMAMVFTMACKTKSDGEFKPKLYYTIDGVVTNINGDTLQNVRAEVTDYVMEDRNADKPTGTFVTLTDEDGAFSLEIIAYDRLDSVSLKISRDSYTTNYLTVGVMQDQTVNITSVLQTLGSFQNVTFSTTQNTTVTGTGGATVTFGPNTVRTASGGSVSEARVSVTAIDTTANTALLPGDQYGMENGLLKIFTTFGMIEIKVQDGQGNPLSLASGATATVSIPLGEIVGPNPPATASMWYYNESSASWLPQGSLTLNNTGTAYEGTVTHFSIFNAGVTADTTYLKGNVVDQADNGIYNAEVSLFTSLFSNYGIWQATYTTGPDIGEWPSILDTSLSGIVPENMRGYIPVPAGFELNVRLKYIKPSDKTVFECRSGQPAPAAGVADTRRLCEMPFVSGAAGATTVYTGAPVMFELETSVFITGTVKYENGDPAANTWLYFLDPANSYSTIKFGHVKSDGTLENVGGTFPWFTYSGNNVPIPDETTGVMLISTGAPTAGIAVKSWFVDGNGVLDFDPDYAGGSDIAKVFTSGIKGTTTNFEITLIGGGSGPVVEDTPLTYVKGIANLEDGTLAPAGTWVVFNGAYKGAPVVIRAQVAADGTFPDPNGPFEYTVLSEGANAGNYVAIPAETDFRIEGLDVVEDPVNPDIIFTFDYKSEKEDVRSTITMTSKARVKGNVRDADTDSPLADVMVRFIETNPPENEDTEEEGDYLDPDTVTVYTDASGNFPVAVGGVLTPVALKFDTQYTVIVSEYETVGNKKQPTNEIWTTYYVSKKDGTLDMLYMPPAPPVVTGTIMNSNGTGPGAYAYFTITPVAGGTAVNILATADGTSFNEVGSDYQPISTDGRVTTLLPNTQYRITRFMQSTVLYTFTTPAAGQTLTIHVVLP